MSWDPRSLPDLSGRVIAVTGATAGIGFFAAEQLLSAGAHVIVLGRSAPRLRRAADVLAAGTSGAGGISTAIVDTADLDSARAAGRELGSLPRLDAIVANAGTLTPDAVRCTTTAGLELTMATNHLGHVALLAEAYPALARTTDSRFVSCGSYATRHQPFVAGDLQSAHDYSARGAYIQSKHAVEIFGFELDRRLRAAGSAVRSIVAHPGGSLEAMTPRRGEIAGSSRLVRTAAAPFGRLAQGKDRGAWSLVRAAVDDTLPGGSYIGPAHLRTGRPTASEPVVSSRDPALGTRLWADSLALAQARIVQA